MKGSPNNDDTFNQLLLLDGNAQIVESCDTLFDTQTNKIFKQPATIWSPFIESIFSYLWTIKAGTPEVLFSRVERPLDQLQGFYDFTFSTIIIENNKYLLWTIFDYTPLYEALQRNQQRVQEIELQRQSLNSKIRHIIRKNLSIQQRDTIPSHTSKLLQANNIILNNIFRDLDQISDFLKTRHSQYWTSHFALQQVIDTIFNNLQQHPRFANWGDLSIASTMVLPTTNLNKSFKGDPIQLTYIIWQLLTLSEDNDTPKSSVPVTELLQIQEKKHTADTVTYLIAIHNPFIQNMDSPTLQSNLALLRKIITWQQGMLTIDTDAITGTQFIFEQTFEHYMEQE